MLSFLLIDIFTEQVTAADGDRDRVQDIVYFLTGQGIYVDNPDQSQFEVNRTSGEIFVKKVSIFSLLASCVKEIILIAEFIVSSNILVVS